LPPREARRPPPLAATPPDRRGIPTPRRRRCGAVVVARALPCQRGCPIVARGYGGGIGHAAVAPMHCSSSDSPAPADRRWQA